MTNSMTRIGLISDTHGLLRKEAVEALRGSELILHAGDGGKPEIFEGLRKIAPGLAVRGNVDIRPVGEALTQTMPSTPGVRSIGGSNFQERRSSIAIFPAPVPLT